MKFEIKYNGLICRYSDHSFSKYRIEDKKRQLVGNYYFIFIPHWFYLSSQTALNGQISFCYIVYIYIQLLLFQIIWWLFWTC